MSTSFLASAEFKERYGSNISNEKYVETLYLNVLNRELDQGGYDYWVGNLNNGVEQRHEVLLGFSESAENKLLFTKLLMSRTRQDLLPKLSRAGWMAASFSVIQQ